MFKDLLRHAAWPTPTVAVALRSRPPPREGAKAPQRAKIDGKLTALLLAFMQELSVIRVLDPACGSGNFLYVSLLLLLDLWKEVWLYMEELGLQRPFALEGFCPSPLQLHGIELNEYAHELAQVTIWIGYIQWLRDNGFGTPSEPILKPIDTIVQMDAILAYDAEGKPVEPEWPAAEVVVGNPPFLGDKRMRSQLGDKYVDDLRNLYEGCVPGGADLVTYWFERAREMIVLGRVQRSGLLATQSIRMGGSRRVLDRVKESGDIFMAWSDRRWAVEGAAVRVSMVGFDDGSDQTRMLDGKAVTVINADLTAATDLTTAVQLTENRRLCFQGPVKVGPFEIDPLTAQTMLATSNPNGRSSSEVLAPWLNGQDITGRSRGLWIIDFGEMTIDDACLFEQPFEYVRSHVKPLRDSNNDAQRRKNWWRLGRSGGDLKSAKAGLLRIIATPRVAKHRLFVWAPSATLPDSRLFAICRDDDYFFGVLHSRPHEVWSLATSSRHGVGNDPTYNNTTCFETFPFPWPPGHEPTDDPRVVAIAEAARELVEKRDRWLNPDGASEAELKKRTLTNLYNQRPTWLALAHGKLDAAVGAAYGWPEGVGDDEVLERLLALNGERAGGG